MAGSVNQHPQKQVCLKIPLSRTQDAGAQHVQKAAARSFSLRGISCGASNTTQDCKGGGTGDEIDLPELVEFSSETKPVLGDMFRGSPRDKNDPPIQGPGLEQLVKGAWSKEEDRILLQHVSICGEKDWNRVKKVYGLRRTGKSCRLRYLNHLRPNLRRHRFSPDEERILMELQSQHGNKWARIAKHLPGRTDNEVKNAWHVRRKKEQRELEKAAKHEAEVRSGVRLPCHASCESSANGGKKSMAHSQGKAKLVQTKGTQAGPPGIPLRKSAQSDTKDLMCFEQLFDDPRTNPPTADSGAGKVVIGVPVLFPGLALPDGSYPATWNRSFALCTGYPAEGLFPRSTTSSTSCSLGLQIPVGATSQPPPVTSTGSPGRRRVSTEAPFLLRSLGDPQGMQHATAPTKPSSVISTGCAPRIHASSPRPSVQSSGSSVGERRSSDALSPGPFGPLKRQSLRPLSAVDSSRSSSFCCHVAKMERVASTGANLAGGLVGEEVHALPSPRVGGSEGGSCRDGAPPVLSACWNVPERLAPPKELPALSPPKLVVPADPMAEDAIWADHLFLSPIGPVRTISPVGELLPSGLGPLFTPRFASPDPVLGMQARMDGLGTLLTSRDMEYGLEGPSNSGLGASPTALFPEWPVLPFPGVVPLLEDRDSQTDKENSR